MEKIINNPGLQHLAENVFWNLDVENLKQCAQINYSCKQILQNPLFCLRKFNGLSKENQNEWIEAIQSVNNSDKGIAIISYLRYFFSPWENLKKTAIVDLPCFTSNTVQDDFRKKVRECCRKYELSDEDVEMVKILAPLTNNPNALDRHGNTTPFNLAALNGHTEIVKILAPLTNNPNAPDRCGYTPIHIAARNGHTEIVKILAPKTGNPNA